MKPRSRRTGSEQGDTKHQHVEWTSQHAYAESGRYTKDWIDTVAVDGLPNGAPEKSAAIGCGIVQLCLDHEGELWYEEYGTVPATWECQKSIKRCQVFALRIGRRVSKQKCVLVLITFGIHALD